MKLLMITETNGGFSVKNKTLVANMQHVKWKEIPPLKGPDSQGLNVPTKQVTTIKNSENINGRYRQSPTKRRD
jgi:uncharacterized protein YjdB